MSMRWVVTGVFAVCPTFGFGWWLMRGPPKSHSRSTEGMSPRGEVADQGDASTRLEESADRLVLSSVPASTSSMHDAKAQQRVGPVEEPLTPELSRRIGTVELLSEHGDAKEATIKFVRDESADLQTPAMATEVLEDWQIQEMIEEGGPKNLATLGEALLSNSYDLESRQDILANIDPLFDSDASHIALLKQLVGDESQPDDLRVDALRKLSDFGMDHVRVYSSVENSEITSEIDLLERLESYRKQTSK